MRNETRTFRFLKQILPNVKITRQYRIDEKVWHNEKIIKHFIKPDFYFTLGGEEHIIEYNGRQHYEPSKRYGKKAFERQQIRDAWLREYCIKKKIVLLEIDGRKVTGDKIKKLLMQKFGHKKPLGN